MKYLYLLLIFTLTSCVEIIDDIKLNLDGSGVFKYTINLSQSKTSVTSILALDSLEGKKVMKLPEIKENVKTFKEHLSKEEGISNVIITENYTEYIIKIECKFKNIEILERAIKGAIAKMDKNIKEDDKTWVKYSDKKLSKSVPDYSLTFLNKITGNYYEKLKAGTYTSIVRFDNLIDNYTNKLATKSKSGTALMVKTTPDKLIENPNILDNTVSIK